MTKILILLTTLFSLFNCQDATIKNTSEVAMKPVPVTPFSRGEVKDRRWCCKLHPSGPDVASDDVFIDSDLIRRFPHYTEQEEIGIIYTDKLGFFDLAHGRSHVDWYYQILENLVNNKAQFNFVGDAELAVTVNNMPSDLMGKSDLARYILRMYSLFYEWATYDLTGSEQTNDERNIYDHPSSFSPEDIPSDLCAAQVGENIIRNNGFIGIQDYRNRVANELANLIDSLGPVSQQETYNRWLLIKDKWTSWDQIPAIGVYKGPLAGLGTNKNMGNVGKDFLKKLNMDVNVSPWLVLANGQFGASSSKPPCLTGILAKEGSLQSKVSINFSKVVGGNHVKSASSSNIKDLINALANNLGSSVTIGRLASSSGGGSSSSSSISPECRSSVGYWTCLEFAASGGARACNPAGKVVTCNSCLDGVTAGLCPRGTRTPYHDQVSGGGECGAVQRCK